MTTSSETENISKKNIVPAYSDQCYLVDNIAEVSSWKDPSKNVLDSSLDNVICTTTSGGTAGILFLNKLTRAVNAQTYISTFPKDYIHAGGYHITIYKELSNGYKHRIYPLHKDVYSAGTEQENIAGQRTASIPLTLKRLSWDYLGTQPAEVDYFIDCVFDFEINASKEFFKPRSWKTPSEAKPYAHPNNPTGLEPPGGFSKYSWSYKDLIVRPRSRALKDGHLIKNQKDFRILLEVRYEISDKQLSKANRAELAKGRIAATGVASEAAYPPGYWRGFTRFMKDCKLDLYLSLKKNTVELMATSPQQKRFKLTLEYNGAVESAFLSPRANVLLPPETEEQRKNRDKYEESVNKAALELLEGHQLSPAEKDKLRGMDIKDVESAASGFNLMDEADVIEEQVFGEDKYINEKTGAQAGVDFLRKKHELELQYFQDQKANKLAAAYRRILDELAKKRKIYYIQKTNKDLLNWFQTRSKVKHLSDSQIQDLNEKIQNDPTGKTEEGREAKEKLDTYQTDRDAAKSVLASETQSLQKKPAVSKERLQESDVFKDKFKEQESYVKSSEENRGEAYKKLQKATFGREDISNLEEPKDDEKIRNIMFFYFGDMLDVVVDFLQENSNDIGLDIWNKNQSKGDREQVKFILGNIEYSEAATNKKRIVNLADIPISVELWDEWWHRTVVKRLAENYPFKAFLRDSLINLVKNAFTNRCKVPGQTINQVRLNVDHVPYYNNRVSFQPKGTSEGGTRYYANLTGQGAGGSLAGHMVYVYATSNSTGYFTGREAVDGDNGVYHILAEGHSRTILHSMSFSKVDQPFLLEAKAEKSGVMRDDLQLSEPYNASMTVFGLTLWKPGRYLYIKFDPDYFTPEQAKSLGLGGYYLITKTSNELTLFGGMSYKWKSGVELKWDQFPDTTQKPSPVYDTTPEWGSPAWVRDAARDYKSKNSWSETKTIDD